MFWVLARQVVICVVFGGFALFAYQNKMSATDIMALQVQGHGRCVRPTCSRGLPHQGGEVTNADFTHDGGHPREAGD
jgi:hypothetical protein